MESHRQGHRVIPVARDRQRGITFIGLVILAMLVGIVGLAALKVTPMYIMNMKLSKALTDIPEQLEGKEVTPQNIRYALDKRFSVEDINNLPADAIKIMPSKNGFSVRIIHENRAPYIADVWLMVVFDKSVEIKK
jgi:Tfp pilus assembly protein PilE